MATDDKKDNNIIPFPGTNTDSNTLNHHTAEPEIPSTDNRPTGSLHSRPSAALIVSIAGILVSLIAIFGPFLIKNIGGTKITDSYTMPYDYVDSPIVTPPSISGDTTSSEQKYSKACAVRTAFSCSKMSKAQATDNVLNIHRIEPYNRPDIQYFSLVDDNTVKFYAINCGAGESSASSFSLQAHYYENENVADAELVTDWNTIAETSSPSAFPLEIPALPGGDAIEYYSFELTYQARQELYNGKRLMITGSFKNISDSEEMGLTLGILCFFDGEIIMEHGGMGDDTEPFVNYAYIDVENTKNGDSIPVHASFPIQDRAVADTVIVPDSSCIIEYSITYQVDEETLTTETFVSDIYVPLYSVVFVPEISQFMSQHDLDYYQYHSLSELHDKIWYNPADIIENENSK